MDYTATNYASTSAVASYANWLQRVGAYLIDGIIAGVPSWIGLPFYLASMDANGNPSAAGLAVYVVLSLVSLGIQIYNRWILAGRTGQSWGKRALSLNPPTGCWLGRVDLPDRPTAMVGGWVGWWACSPCRARVPACSWASSSSG